LWNLRNVKKASGWRPWLPKVTQLGPMQDMGRMYDGPRPKEMWESGYLRAIHEPQCMKTAGRMWLWGTLLSVTQPCQHLACLS
jgi:hypothetical protein